MEKNLTNDRASTRLMKEAEQKEKQRKEQQKQARLLDIREILKDKKFMDYYDGFQ